MQEDYDVFPGGNISCSVCRKHITNGKDLVFVDGEPWCLKCAHQDFVDNIKDLQLFCKYNNKIVSPLFYYNVRHHDDDGVANAITRVLKGRYELIRLSGDAHKIIEEIHKICSISSIDDVLLQTLKKQLVQTEIKIKEIIINIVNNTKKTLIKQTEQCYNCAKKLKSYKGLTQKGIMICKNSHCKHFKEYLKISKIIYGDYVHQMIIKILSDIKSDEITNAMYG